MSDKDVLARARVFVDALMAAPDPLPFVSACAVAGNAWQESLITPVTLGPKDHGSDGVLQWRLDRLDALKRWPDWDRLETQARYFKAECKENYPRLWDQLSQPGPRGLYNLTANITDIYERPSIEGRAIDKRLWFARNIADTLSAENAQVPLPAPVPAPVPAPASVSGEALMNPLVLEIIAKITPLVLEAVVNVAMKLHAQQQSAQQLPQPSPELIGVIEKIVADALKK